MDGHEYESEPTHVSKPRRRLPYARPRAALMHSAMSDTSTPPHAIVRRRASLLETSGELPLPRIAYRLKIRIDLLYIFRVDAVRIGPPN